MPRVSAEDAVLYAKLKEAIRPEYYFTAGTETHPSQKMMCGLTEDYYTALTHHTVWTHILAAGQELIALPQMVLDSVFGQNLSANNPPRPKRARLDVRIIRKGEGDTLAISRLISLVICTANAYNEVTIQAPVPGVRNGALVIPQYEVPGDWREDLQWHTFPSVRHLITGRG